MLRTGADFMHFVGSRLDIVKGYQSGDGWRVAVGVGFLILDVATLGGSSIVKGVVKTSVKAGSRSIVRNVVEVGKSLVTKYPAKSAVSGTVEMTFLRQGDVIDRYGSMSGKWFSKPGTSYGARSIPPGQTPYTQFRVRKPFEVNKSLASPGAFGGQTGFGTQFQSPVGADVLIKRGIIVPFK